jgi:hypothetical protein
MMSDRLVQMGYTLQETREMLRMANMMARGGRPVVSQDNPLHRRLQVSDLNSVAQFFAQCRARPRESPQAIMRERLREAGGFALRGPERQFQAMAVPRRAPPTTPHRYEVTMRGRTYTVYSSEPISLRPRGRGESRQHPLIEAIRAYENGEQSPVMAVWRETPSPRGRGQPGTEEVPRVRLTTFRRRFADAFRRGQVGDTVLVQDASKQTRTQRRSPG